MKTLLTLLAFSSMISSAIAGPIIIDSTNFSRITGSPVSDTYTGQGHVSFQYIGATDFLNSDQRFTLTFNYTSTGSQPSAGAAFWFGSASAANWVFVNEEGAVSSLDQLRNFSSRNLVGNANNGGNVTTTDSIPDGDLIPNTNFNLIVERTLNAGNYFLAVQVRNVSTNALIADFSGINVGTDASWGITSFSATDALNVSTLSTINLIGLDVSAIPEPSAFVMLLSAIGLLVLFRRRTRLG